MNCPLLSEQTSDVLLDYSAGRLDAARATTLQKHVLVCDACSAFLAGQAEVWAALDTWKAPPVSISFNRRLWQKLRFRIWKSAVPVAAAALIIMIGFVYDHKSQKSQMEIDQVERTLDDIQLLRQFDVARAL
ncbi:MAG: hypothetical protein QOJ99_5419 [Bryobacterales bacterium]|jgi:hypothetical protein|nr:hypothetical protein [Bryobacterales bacterium]